MRTGSLMAGRTTGEILVWRDRLQLRQDGQNVTWRMFRVEQEPIET